MVPVAAHRDAQGLREHQGPERSGVHERQRAGAYRGGAARLLHPARWQLPDQFRRSVQDLSALLDGRRDRRHGAAADLQGQDRAHGRHRAGHRRLAPHAVPDGRLHGSRVARQRARQPAEQRHSRARVPAARRHSGSHRHRFHPHLRHRHGVLVRAPAAAALDIFRDHGAACVLRHHLFRVYPLRDVAVLRDSRRHTGGELRRHHQLPHGV